MAGACCLVKFANYTANPEGPTKSITMNINSTGAKSWLSSYMYAVGSKEGIILMYNGSSYNSAGPNNSNQYGDYQD